MGANHVCSEYGRETALHGRSSLGAETSETQGKNLYEGSISV